MSQSLNSGPFRKMDGVQSGGPKSGTWSLHTIDTCVKKILSVCYPLNVQACMACSCRDNGCQNLRHMMSKTLLRRHGYE